MRETRVVVTGIGVVSSIGTGRAAFWEALLSGQSGITPVAGFDTRDCAARIGGEVKDFEPERFIRPRHVPRYGRASQLGIAAARLALEDAGLDPRVAGARVSVFLGSTMGECGVQERLASACAHEGPGAIERRDVLMGLDSVMPLNIGRELGLQDADALVFPNACAAGNYAIGHGYDQIRAGRTDVVLAGGADAFSRLAYIGFGRMLALAPERCQPFDLNRQGIVIGEGAGLLVLEGRERAQARGARIYAELLGYALSCDAHHMTIPHVDGVSAVMRKACAAAGVTPDAVDLVSAHGTGTRMNDRTECEALGRVFGEHARRVPIVSIKSMLGHTMGAASALEAVACVMAVHDGRIPPTINFETPDPECPVDCVPNTMREAPVRVALNNSFAFGGNNAATVFARCA
jgi:3-oxoacyl-[acyl-carrier-protein] synthase II